MLVLPAGISPSPYRRCLAATGSLNAAIVLERLTYWWAKGTYILKRDGQWRAKPRNQLMQECGLSRNQCDRALAQLKARGLIETSQHRFGGKLRAVMHYRMLPKAVVAGLTGMPGPAPKKLKLVAAPGMPGFLTHEKPIDHDRDISSPYSHYVSTNVETSFEKGGEVTLADASGGGDFTKNSTGEDFPKKETPPPKAPAPLASAGGLPQNGATSAKMVSEPAPITVSSKINKPKAAQVNLGTVWLEAYRKAYPHGAAPVLSSKERHQLKQIADKLPPGRTIEIICKVVANWTDFIIYTTSWNGAFDMPKRPEIRLVLRFLNTAVNMETSDTKSPTPVTTTAPSKPLDLAQATKPLLPAQPQHVPATLEEIKASLYKPSGLPIAPPAKLKLPPKPKKAS